MRRNLYRVRTNAMLGGVCTGLAEYLDLDVTLVRLLFIVLGIASGTGFLIYLILWIVLPEKEKITADSAPFQPSDIAGRAREMGQELGEAVRRPNPEAGKFVGIALVIAGIIFLLNNLNIPWLWWLRGDVIWPIVLILGGILLVARSLRKE